ncbi:hypothetical protein [Limnohabitans sp.]|jgi:hypothetical protein|uniref:hypothetical protein n=1 Tax=Limnohabitans sp. TaxID=1907725 RepID=UPI0037C17677
MFAAADTTSPCPWAAISAHVEVHHQAAAAVWAQLVMVFVSAVASAERAMSSLGRSLKMTQSPNCPFQRAGKSQNGAALFQIFVKYYK